VYTIIINNYQAARRSFRAFMGLTGCFSVGGVGHICKFATCCGVYQFVMTPATPSIKNCKIPEGALGDL
jgi:hypothetical protein